MDDLLEKLIFTEKVEKGLKHIEEGKAKQSKGGNINMDRNFYYRLKIHSLIYSKVSRVYADRFIE